MSKPTFNVADNLLTRLLPLDVTERFQIPGNYVKHFTKTLEHFSSIESIGFTNTQQNQARQMCRFGEHT